jgi:hypothetical protein
VVAGLNGGGGDVGAGGDRTVGNGARYGVAGGSGDSGRGARRLVGEERQGVGGRGTLGTASPLSRSGSRRGPRGPGSRRENARAHRTSKTGTRGEGPRCLEAASVGVILRPTISLRLVAVIFGLGVGLVEGWSSGRGEVAGRDPGTVVVPRSSSRGPLGWVGSGAGRATAAGWGAGGLGSGLHAEARAASTSSTTVHSRSRRWSMALASSDVGGTSVVLSIWGFPRGSGPAGLIPESGYTPYQVRGGSLGVGLGALGYEFDGRGAGGARQDNQNFLPWDSLAPGPRVWGGDRSRVHGCVSSCQWRPVWPDIPEHAFPRGCSPHPSAAGLGADAEPVLAILLLGQDNRRTPWTF